MMESKVVAITIKLMPSFFMSAITQCNKSNNFLAKLKLYHHGLPNCLIHFKQPHSNMHGHLDVSQKVNN
jgi:hypothetical protein